MKKKIAVFALFLIGGILMSYNKIGWANSPSTKTPISAKNLEQMDEGIYQAHSQLAQIANDTVKKDEITNGVYPLDVPGWTYLYEDLPDPSEENKGGYLYCKDGDGINGAGNYRSTGTSWQFAGTGDEGYNIVKADLELMQKENGISVKQINSSSEVTEKIKLNDTSSDGTCWRNPSNLQLLHNNVAGYKKMIIRVEDLPDKGVLYIPYDGVSQFTIIAGTGEDWSNEPTVVQTYASDWLNNNTYLAVTHLGWNFNTGDKFATLNIETLKSYENTRPAFYFYIINNNKQWFVPYVIVTSTVKKELDWLTVKEDNLSNDLKEKINSNIPPVNQPTYSFLSYYPRKILCIGDSLTRGQIAGYSPARYEEGVNYPAYFARMTGAECTNAGVSGITTQNWYLNEREKYDYTDYDMVFIFLGTNGGLQDTVSGANTNDQTGYYCSLIEYIRSKNPNIKIVLFGNVEPYYDRIIAKIANYYGLPFLDIYGQSYYGIRRRNPNASELTEPTIYHPAPNDWVHFSRIGYCTLARIVYLLLGEKIIEMPEYFDGTY